MVHRCGVCGYGSDEDVCPRCNTILRRDRAVCPRCGKMFSGWIALCDACGAGMGPEPDMPADAEAVRTLALVPGVTEGRAKELVARGFRDFSEVVRLALPERAVRMGVHHAIARKAMLADLLRRPGGRESDASRCPMCGAAWLDGAARCAACGSAPDLALDPAVVEQKLREITGEILDLGADADFRGMAEDVRRDLMEAFGGPDEEDLLRDGCRHQIEAWRAKGFDVGPLERLLQEDVAHFMERGARLIRAQVLKRSESGRYRCPLCEIALDATAEECTNCGARFA